MSGNGKMALTPIQALRSFLALKIPAKVAAETALRSLDITAEEIDKLSTAERLYVGDVLREAKYILGGTIQFEPGTRKPHDGR